MTDPATEKEIEELIADFQRSGLRELHVRVGDTEIYLSNDPDAAGIGAQITEGIQHNAQTASTPSESVTPAEQTPATKDYPVDAHIVSAPYLGTFYGAPKPGAPNYVEVGSVVTAETELCLVEVMKLFTAVRAGTAGTIHSILANDGQLVQADQPLFAIVPN